MAPLGAALLLIAAGLTPAPGAFAQTTAAPVITSEGPFTVDEGETAIATLTATDADTAPGDLTWSRTGGADSDKFSLTAAGVLTFAAAGDYEDPDDADGDRSYEVTVQVSDRDNTDTANLVVILANVTELITTIAGPTTVSFAENGAGRVATFTASTDEDRDGIEWILAGTDREHFTIDSPAGALRFHIDPVSPNIFPKLPDFEDPNDGGTDNVYSITLLARVGSAISSSHAVTVTVTDEDEGGSLSFSSKRPRQGVELTATLSDPDGVSAGTVTWQWERSTGRDSWAVVAGAASGSYTPVAADTNAFLRVTATYDDEHGEDHGVAGTPPNVVLGPLLTSVTVTTNNAASNTAHALRPTFDAEVLHYGIGCDESDTMALTLSAPSGSRLAVDGEQVAPGTDVELGVTETTSVQVTLSGGDGAETTYVIHCMPQQFFEWQIIKHAGTSGVLEDLIAFGHPGYISFTDNNGVPRYLTPTLDDLRPPRFFKIGVFRVGGDGAFRYAYRRPTETRSSAFTVLDAQFKTHAEGIQTRPPLTHTDSHDFRVLENGDYLLLAYNSAIRYLGHLTFLDPMRDPSVKVYDSAIQIVTPRGQAKFTWNSWDHMAIEDCVQHRFPIQHPDTSSRNLEHPGYAHVNSAQAVDDLIVASFRGCSKVLGIDVTTGEVAWRIGLSNLSEDDWAGRDIGPAPMGIVNDPEGQFCGQHAAQILPNGHLLLYDNGTRCVMNPWTNEPLGRDFDTFSRAVEYALDHENNEVVFVRDHSLRGERSAFAWSSGDVEVLDNGDWLVSWGRTRSTDPLLTDNETVTQVDPATGVEKFAIRFVTADSANAPRIIASAVPPEALAPQPGSLTAHLPASSHSSVFHGGATDSPQVVVAFSRPVVDFDETSPSFNVTGATVASVSAHVVAGEPSNAYLVTLTPDGDGAISFSLVAGHACAAGGICTADGATLSAAPATFTIGPAPSVAFEEAAYSVGEGSARSVALRLSAAHRGARGVTVPVLLHTTGTASDSDLMGGGSVTFEAGETRKTITVEALHDDLIEGNETAMLAFGDLPDGLTASATATATVTVTDTDRAQIDFRVGVSQVSEGGETRLTFTITNGVTFERDQPIDLTIGGTATPGDDFTLVDAASNNLSAPYALTFPAGASAIGMTFRAVDDTDIEPAAETVIMSARLALTNTLLGTRTVAIPPSDVPDIPGVAMFVGGGSMVTEGEDAPFILLRTTATNLPVSEPLTVSVEVTATGSTLSGATPTSATFDANSYLATVWLTTLDDQIVEPPGSVTVLVLGSTSNPPVYLTGANNAFTLAVSDNDVAAFTVSASAEEVAEGATVTVTIAADGVTFAEPQAITLMLGGTATPGEDFSIWSGAAELSDPYTVKLPAGARSALVSIRTKPDGEDDQGETVELTASHDGNAIGAVTVTITAPAPPPVVLGSFGGGGGPSGPTPSDVEFEWNVERDIEELDSGHNAPTGAWSDGVRVWLLQNGSGADDAVYAYDLTTGERVEDREFELDDTNRAPRGVWSNGETVWVSDSGQNRLFAYDLESGERVPELDLVLAARNRDARGIWSDGKTMWVLDGGKDSLFAYDLAGGDLIAEYALDGANSDPHGLWSDGVSVWISDHTAKRLFAYSVPSLPESEPPKEPPALERVVAEEFEEPGRVGNNSPRGIWSDGEVMYVVDALDGRVYTYNMPDAIEVRLASLALSGVDIGEFDPGVREYDGSADTGVSETTIEAEAMQRLADIDIDPPDADEGADGHQVTLEGVAEITVTVTSADGARKREYRVRLGQEEATGTAAECLRGAVAVGFSILVYQGGSVGDLLGCAESRHVRALYALHEGEYLSHILGAPDFVNAAFGELYRDGVPALTALVARSVGPATPDPAAGGGADGTAWPVCLRGEIVEGFSLALYEGGSVDALAACAQSLGVTAVYTLADGEYVSYILGAPEFVNAGFAELFAGGVPPITPLVARSETPPAGGLR